MKTKIEATHTKTPWTLEKEDSTYSNCIELRADGIPIAHVESWNGEDVDNQIEAKRNAQFILKAVNNFEALLEAVKQFSAVSCFENHDTERWPEYQKLQEAIEQAEGK